MVDLMREACRLIVSDYRRYYVGGGKYVIFKLLACALTARNHCFAYSFWLRLASKGPSPLRQVARLMHYRLSRRYGVQIPVETRIGEGLYIGHGVGIVVNGGTVIGDNCNLSQFVSIGTNHGTPAVIGNNVYIGPNVCVVEDVRIGDNATIGAGSVVVHDVPENATVAGVPARVLNYNDPGRYCRCV